MEEKCAFCSRVKCETCTIKGPFINGIHLFNVLDLHRKAFVILLYFAVHFATHQRLSELDVSIQQRNGIEIEHHLLHNIHLNACPTFSFDISQQKVSIYWLRFSFFPFVRCCCCMCHVKWNQNLPNYTEHRYRLNELLLSNFQNERTTFKAKCLRQTNITINGIEYH